MNSADIMYFTMEELSLIAAAGQADRGKAIESIVAGIPFAEGEQAARVARSAAAKLMSTTDAQYADINFAVINDFE